MTLPVAHFSALQQQVLKAMALPIWQRPELPAAPLTLIGGDALLCQSRLYGVILQLLTLEPSVVAEAASPHARGRCWLLTPDCPAPRLEGDCLITPPWPQLLQHKRQLWQLLQSWL